MIEISRKQAQKMKADYQAWEFTDMTGQDYLMFSGQIFIIKEDKDADQKKEESQENKPEI